MKLNDTELIVSKDLNLKDIKAEKYKEILKLYDILVEKEN
jgi:hypothetical protein